ncbi:hypothetical protein TPAR_08114, partial [Tolypocladium paradoxum]
THTTPCPCSRRRSRVGPSEHAGSSGRGRAGSALSTIARVFLSSTGRCRRNSSHRWSVMSGRPSVYPNEADSIWTRSTRTCPSVSTCPRNPSFPRPSAMPDAPP